MWFIVFTASVTIAFLALTISDYVSRMNPARLLIGLAVTIIVGMVAINAESFTGGERVGVVLAFVLLAVGYVVDLRNPYTGLEDEAPR